MGKSNVILGGDLNLILTMGEVWGENPKQDALSAFFLYFFEKGNLVDVVPLKLEPTWRNNRGAQSIFKILDHFMVVENILNGNLILRSTIETGGNFDHRPISLIVRVPDKKPLLLLNSIPCGWRRTNTDLKFKMPRNP